MMFCRIAANGCGGTWSPRGLHTSLTFVTRCALAALNVREILRDRRWAADTGVLAALDMVDVLQDHDVVEVEDIGVVQT